jgi:hypothetical protein
MFWRKKMSMNRSTLGGYSTSGQMNASLGSTRPEAPGQNAMRFGKIGIPAVAAAAELLKAKKPVEKPVHVSFYLGSD